MKEYLTKQIVTYIGNKRELLNAIEKEILFVCKKLNKPKLVTLDMFSGSGVVARLLKLYSSKVIANDLEHYSSIINDCYLSNKTEFDVDEFNKYLILINKEIKERPINGIIRKHYSPYNEKNITKNDRVFYTISNATYIDSFRYYIDEFVPNNYKKFFLAPLLVEASIHVNTCGVFKGFYKDSNTGIGKYGGKDENALARIKGKINITPPILCDENTKYEVYQFDASELAKKLKDLDLVYLDPPYNQHPYGSNYFMLNIIAKNKIEGKLSRVSGIPNDWNHSVYNVKAKALDAMRNLIKVLDAKYILISYNNEGFITFEEMRNMLSEYGSVKTKFIKYNAFRGSRNLKNRDLYTNEFLFLLKKE